MNKYWDVGYIYLQNGIVFMNDFLSIYSMSILTYLYVETTAYKFRIYSMITMKELAKLNHRTRCCCFVKLIYCCQDFGVAAFACVKALNNTVRYIRSSVSCSLDIYVLRGHLTAHYQLWSTLNIL